MAALYDTSNPILLNSINLEQIGSGRKRPRIELYAKLDATKTKRGSAQGIWAFDRPAPRRKFGSHVVFFLFEMEDNGQRRKSLNELRERTVGRVFTSLKKATLEFVFKVWQILGNDCKYRAFCCKMFGS